ncbi:hypothetical protein [Enterovirga sp. CN4-39]|uniref:hypothetical protein n=1 Tax=Enterovirga sp. CN4-39 TaxID=3400910 RepID=UPI003C0E5C74
MAAANDRLKEKIEQLMSTAVSKEGATNTLALLFPKADNVLQTYAAMDRSGRNRRLSDRHHALSYFRLNPQAATWSRSELAILFELPPAVTFEQIRQRIDAEPEQNKSRLRRLLLDELANHYESGHPLNADHLSHLADFSSYLISAQDEDRGLFSMPNIERMRWVIGRGLKSLSASERSAVIIDAILSASDLTALSFFVRTVSPDINPDGSTSKSDELGFADRAEEIRQILTNRIRELAESGEIWGQAKPDVLLWFWWSSTDGREVTEFMTKEIEAVGGAERVLPHMISEVASTAGNYENISRSWSKIVDFQLIYTQARNLAESDEERTSQVGLRVLKALERSRNSPL